MKTIRSEIFSLDDVDKQLIQALSADARTPNAELARLVGYSPPAVAERIKRMEEAGVIQGYRVQINPERIGLNVAVWLRVRPVPGKLVKVAETIKGLPQIVSCDRITGEDCFIAKAYVRSVGDLEALIDKIIPNAMTTTSVIQSSPVPPRSTIL